MLYAFQKQYVTVVQCLGYSRGLDTNSGSRTPYIDEFLIHHMEYIIAPLDVVVNLKGKIYVQCWVQCLTHVSAKEAVTSATIIYHYYCHHRHHLKILCCRCPTSDPNCQILQGAGCIRMDCSALCPSVKQAGYSNRPLKSTIVNKKCSSRTKWISLK